MIKLTFKGGIKFSNIKNKKKLTENNSVKIFNSSPFIYLPLKQHIGNPSIPIVNIGDKVKIGQLIAKNDGEFSSNLHASVSGTILSIEKHPEPSGNISETIIIKNDMKNDMKKIKILKNIKKITGKEIIRKIKDSGIVGLGGATFPTHLKYISKKKCDILILNGIECEPYNTADYITMKKHPKLIIKGLQLLMKASSAKKGIICIKNNKKNIYKSFLNLTKNIKNISIKTFKDKYPQGSEKQLIYALKKKEIPYGKFPIDINIIVNNICTAKSVAEAVIEGKPLTHHYITITGDGLRNPKNYFVPIGTPIKNLIELSKENLNNKILLTGGVMMGKSMYTDNIPVTKGINAFIILKNSNKKIKEQNCVRCSLCVDKCPSFLEPTTLVDHIKNNNINNLNKLGISACIECGVCSYVCPSYIPLLDYIRKGKIELRRIIKQ